MKLPRLGKLPPREDPRTFRFAKYTKQLATPPAFTRWHSAVLWDKWPMLANDVVGDCAIAAAAHHIHGWTANEGPEPVVLSEEAVLADYSAITGYDPANPETDRGTVMLDALRYWRREGMGGRKIEGYAKINGSKEARQAIWAFGGIYVGLSLPISAQNQNVWRVPAGGARGKGRRGSWGGHAVPVLGYDERGLHCITWGSVKRMSWGFFNTYCDEAYACFSPADWALDGRAPSGFDIDTLRADLNAL